MSDVLVDPVFSHAQVLEISVGILFCCCVLVCFSEVCSEIILECLISRKVDRWDPSDWTAYYCPLKLIDLFFNPIVHLFSSDE